MNKLILFILIALIPISCTQNASEELTTQITNRISIFEVYFKHAKSIDDFSVFLVDTLKLPAEWKPFDFFGNGIVHDAAFYFGNTTLELLALNPQDSMMLEKARFNRILFETTEIDETAEFLQNAGLQHNPPFDFNIFSDKSELKIGRQINLDSLSKKSNVYIAFWEYANAGYNFRERSISGANFQELETKLKSAFEQNPLGVIGLKEVHLSINQDATEKWKRLLGYTNKNKWNLNDGPIIRYSTSDKSLGVDWISIQVKDLKFAKEFLSNIGMSISESDVRIVIDRSEVYGLTIFLEE